MLTRAGLRVLVLERGEYLSYEQVGTDHLRNYRLSAYGNNIPPGLESGYRVAVGPDGVEQLVPPWAADYGALPYTVGGGTRVYQGMAWRLTPEDFRPARPTVYPTEARWPTGPSATTSCSRTTRESSTNSASAVTAPPTGIRGFARPRTRCRRCPATPRPKCCAVVLSNSGWRPGRCRCSSTPCPGPGADAARNVANASASRARPTPRTARSTRCCPRQWRPAATWSPARG